jgi:hypothetical protein
MSFDRWCWFGDGEEFGRAVCNQEELSTAESLNHGVEDGDQHQRRAKSYANEDTKKRDLGVSWKMVKHIQKRSGNTCESMKTSVVWCASKVYLSFCLLSSVNITTISMALITHGCFHEKTTQLHENYFLLHTFPTYTFSVRTEQLFQTKKTHKCYSPQSLQIS